MDEKRMMKPEGEINKKVQLMNIFNGIFFLFGVLVLDCVL
jgi:hypothetical protein